jgi:DNA-binding transcriptional ArsR family regulator
MTAEQLAAIASLLADRTRAAFCLALLDGRAWTISELARHAGVAPSTASEHVARLVAGGVLAGEHQGRHRYVKLADQRVAQLLEDLGAVAPPVASPVRSLAAARASEAMRAARTCYDHLAGALGVQLTDAMTRAGQISQTGGFALTDAGLDWLADRLDIDVPTLTSGRRPVARPCLDWTERKPHLGGSAGAAICGRFFEQGWITRAATSRAVTVTPAGEQSLRQLYGVELPKVA